MMAKSKIEIEGLEISVKKVGEDDYLSLTDIAKRRTEQRPATVLQSWLRNGNTILFLETWEQLHNANFKVSDFADFKILSIDQRQNLTPKRYIELTGAIGIQSSSGRYGGTYAHVDIALEFTTWIDPVLKVYLVKDYQRLKSQESRQLNQEWNLNRFLSKVNYRLQSETIKQNLLPRLDPAKDREIE